MRVQKCMAVAVQVKFIVFPICLMHTYAHHASVWQLIWQRNQAHNVTTCRLPTTDINIYKEARRPRRVIITLCRPEYSILESEILFLIEDTVEGGASHCVWRCEMKWSGSGEGVWVLMIMKYEYMELVWETELDVESSLLTLVVNHCALPDKLWLTERRKKRVGGKRAERAFAWECVCRACVCAPMCPPRVC